MCYAKMVPLTPLLWLHEIVLHSTIPSTAPSLSISSISLMIMWWTGWPLPHVNSIAFVYYKEHLFTCLGSRPTFSSPIRECMWSFPCILLLFLSSMVGRWKLGSSKHLFLLPYVFTCKMVYVYSGSGYWVSNNCHPFHVPHVILWLGSLEKVEEQHICHHKTIWATKPHSIHMYNFVFNICIHLISISYSCIYRD